MDPKAYIEYFDNVLYKQIKKIKETKSFCNP